MTEIELLQNQVAQLAQRVSDQGAALTAYKKLLKPMLAEYERRRRESYPTARGTRGRERL